MISISAECVLYQSCSDISCKRKWCNKCCFQIFLEGDFIIFFQKIKKKLRNYHNCVIIPADTHTHLFPIKMEQKTKYD